MAGFITVNPEIMATGKRNIFKYRRLRDSRYLVRMTFIIVFLILITLIMPRSLRLKFQYEVGKPWQDVELKAPFTFAIYKSQDSIDAERIRVANEIKPIFVRDTTSINGTVNRLLDHWQKISEQAAVFRDSLSEAGLSAPPKGGDNFFTRRYQIQFRQLPELTDETWMKEMQAGAQKYLQAVYEKGFINASGPDGMGEVVALRVMPAREEYVHVRQLLTNRGQVAEFVDSLMIKTGQSPPMEELMRRMVILEVKPNYVYDRLLTERVRREQVALVSPVYGSISEGEKIIGKDEIVDRKTSDILQSLIRDQELRFGQQSSAGIFFGQFFIVLLITMILLSYLSINRPRIYFNNAKLGLILVTILLAVSAMVVATKLNDLAIRLADILGPNLNLSYIYIAPACIVPIFLTNFFGLRTGFIANILVALYGGVLIQQSLEFVFVQMVAGTVAVYSLRRLHKREIFFYTLAYIFLAYTIAYVLFNLYGKGNFADINYRTILLFGINVSITIIAYNLIFLFEQIFGLTSDLTYLELLDTNHPLLKELARKAPGTFHHCLQVANIAEATMNEIGGNALLTHVGALYHDVGKMVNHRFFIENMAEGQNPHDQLNCEESASIIIGHVKRGVELAHKFSLPREIIEFIETHHGTTRVEYFYRIYLKENMCEPPEAEDKFRYPGPKPFSKETAVLMIADSVEAASRAMKNPTPEKLNELVNNIIDYKIRDRQLENSNLTFKDITTIRKVIHKQLLSIYHSRIQYPDEPVKAGNES